ncbi:MAG: hypothetical protein FWB90_08480 [Fibromonadales bacterium]|nr:hypothetical protein [Fibromonadales bacterium]
MESLLEKYTQHEIDNLSGNNRIKIAESEADIRNFVEFAIAGNNLGQKMLLGKINCNLAWKIKTASNSNVDLNAYHLELRANEIKHLFNHHGNEKTEVPRGQRTVTVYDIMSIIDVVQNFDEVKKNFDNSLTFIKNANGTINAITLYATKSKSLSLQTMWINRKGS